MTADNISQSIGSLEWRSRCWDESEQQCVVETEQIEAKWTRKDCRTREHSGRQTRSE